MGYDQYTVPDTVAVEPTFFCFPLALALAHDQPLVSFIPISLKNSALKTRPKIAVYRNTKFLKKTQHSLFCVIIDGS